MSEDKPSNEPAADKPADKGDCDPSQRLSPANDKSVSKVVLFAIEIVALGGVATGLWVFGEHLEKHGYPKIGSFVDFLSCAGFFALVPVTVLKIWPEAKRVWSIFGLFLVVFGILWGLIASNKTELKPDLQFGLALSSTNEAWLTNDFLAKSSFSNNSSWYTWAILSNSSPWLLIPLAGTETNISLIPLLTNRTEIDAEEVSVGISIDSEVKCSAEGWEIAHFEHNTSLVRRGGFFAKHTSGALPVITISVPLPNDKRWEGPRCPVIVMVAVKHVTVMTTSFWLLALPFPADAPPAPKIGIYGGDQIEFLTNGGFMRFHYSKSQMGKSN